MKPAVLYIDEEPMALRIMGKRLQRCFGDEVDVHSIPPEKSIDKMLGAIEKTPNVVSIVIDQRLAATGAATYVGTELANAIRKADRKLPIYILTNFVQDIDPGLADVEYVLSKDDLSDDERMDSIAARLRRHINIFQDILAEREARFEVLLRKGYEEKLSADEEAEFKELSFAREKKIVVSELMEGAELNKKLDSAEEKLRQIEAMLKR